MCRFDLNVRWRRRVLTWASICLAAAPALGHAQGQAQKPVQKPVPMQAQRYGIGAPTSDRAIAAWNIDVDANGAGLPAGSGSVATGQQVYAAKCAACHGVRGEGKPADALVGGLGTLKNDRPIKTIGSFWPYAPTVFDFIRRAMPYNAPQSLTNDEVYATTAYLLHLNGIVPAEAVMDAQSLHKVRMPNRDGFVADDRPDVQTAREGVPK